MSYATLHIQPGMRIAYTGDVCNGRREGTVQSMRMTRWGGFAIVRWDTDEMIGWERDGTPVTYKGEFLQDVALHLIKPTPTAGARWHLLPPGSEA